MTKFEIFLLAILILAALDLAALIGLLFWEKRNSKLKDFLQDCSPKNER